MIIVCWHLGDVYEVIHDQRGLLTVFYGLINIF